MSSTIKIDNQLIASAMEMGKFRSKKEMVEKALKNFIKSEQRKKMLDFAGKNLWEGDIHEMKKI